MLVSKLKGYLIFGTIVAAVTWFAKPSPPPLAESVKTSSLEESKAEEVETTKETFKAPDGSEHTVEKSVRKLLENRKIIEIEKLVFSPEPNWLVGASVSYRLPDITPSYGASLGYRVFHKTYLEAAVFPTEQRAEASLKHFFK